MTEKDSDVYIITQSREHYYYFRYTGLGVNFKIEKKNAPNPLAKICCNIIPYLQCHAIPKLFDGADT